MDKKKVNEARKIAIGILKHANRAHVVDAQLIILAEQFIEISNKALPGPHAPAIVTENPNLATLVDDL